MKVLCNDCIICQLNKPYPNQKQIATKQDFEGQSLYFNHRISFDTKGPYQIIDKPNEVTYKLTDSKKEIIQHRNNLLPYYPKEYALRELTQLYSFTSLHIVRNIPQIEQNQNVHTTKNTKTFQ